MYRKGCGNAESYKKDTEASKGKQTRIRLPSVVNMRKTNSLMPTEVVLDINHHSWAIISVKCNTLIAIFPSNLKQKKKLFLFQLKKKKSIKIQQCPSQLKELFFSIKFYPSSIQLSKLKIHIFILGSHLSQKKKTLEELTYWHKSTKTNAINEAKSS